MMRKLLLLVVVLALISGSLSCGAEKSDVSGTYLCTQGSKDYDKGNILELKKDGTLYAYAPGESGVSGEWKLDGDEIYLIFEFFGLTWKGNIKGDTIFLEEGSVWVKEPGSAPQQAPAPAPAPTPTSEPADFELWAEAAISWAQNNLGSRHWYELCLRFVANAFMQQGDPPAEIPEGTWTSALDAVNGDEDFDLVLKDPDRWENAPRGALIFFGKTKENQFGHVGIYLGDGRMIHSYGKVRIDDVEQIGKLDQGRLIGSYMGWAYPPARWRPRGTIPGTMEEMKPDVTPSEPKEEYLELSSPEFMQIIHDKLHSEGLTDLQREEIWKELLAKYEGKRITWIGEFKGVKESGKKEKGSFIGTIAENEVFFGEEQKAALLGLSPGDIVEYTGTLAGTDSFNFELVNGAVISKVMTPLWNKPACPVPAILSDGVIYFSGGAWDAETGKVIWEKQPERLPGKPRMLVGVDKDYVYSYVDLLTWEHMVHELELEAVDKATGDFIFAKLFTAAKESLPRSVLEHQIVAVNGNIAYRNIIYSYTIAYMQGIERGEYPDLTSFDAIDITTGTALWNTKPDGKIEKAQVSSGILFIIAKNNLRVLNATTGQQIWNLPKVDNFAIEAGNIFTLVNGMIQCRDMKNGKVLWEIQFGSQPIPPAMAAYRSTLFVVGGTKFLGGGEKLYVLDLDSGKILWNKEFRNRITHVLVGGGIVCVWTSSFGGYEIEAFKLVR